MFDQKPTKEEFDRLLAKSLQRFEALGIKPEQYEYLKKEVRVDYNISSEHEKLIQNVVNVAGVPAELRHSFYPLLGINADDFYDLTSYNGYKRYQEFKESMHGQYFVFADTFAYEKNHEVTKYISEGGAWHVNKHRYVEFTHVDQFLDEHQINPERVAYPQLYTIADAGIGKRAIAILNERGIKNFGDLMNVDMDLNPYNLSGRVNWMLKEYKEKNEIISLRDFQTMNPRKAMEKIERGNAIAKANFQQIYPDLVAHGKKKNAIAKQPDIQIEQSAVSVNIIKSSTEIESEHRAQFVDNYIGEILRQNDTVTAFLLPLQDVESGPSLRLNKSLEFAWSLPERESKDGTPRNLTLGDLAVQSDDDLIQSFGFNKDEIGHTHRILTAYGLKNGMREAGDQAYEDFIDSMIIQDESYGTHGANIATRQKENRQKYGL